MRRIGLFLVLAVVTVSTARAQSNTISTYAGGGTNAGAATGAFLAEPYKAIRDASGNTYISAPALNIVYKVDGSGTISIYAGTGIAGFSGDGGLATAAELDFPAGMALDAAGNLYVAERQNNRVRKVDASTKKISTVAGSGTEYDGAGFFGGFSGDNGPATEALLSGPLDVAVDASGNLYIADRGNQIVRFVSAATGIISTFAGTPDTNGYAGDGGPATSALFRAPSAVTLDTAGNLYIADRNNCIVRKVDTTSQHTITTYAGVPQVCGFFGDGGAATSANLRRPLGVFIDAAGTLFIGDTDNSRIRKVDNTAHNISTFAGTATICATPAGCGDGAAAASASLNVPFGAFEDGSGNVLIADTGDMRVRSVATSLTITNYAGGGTGGDGGPATSGLLALPYIANVDGAGNLFILDSQAARVQRVDAVTHNVTTFAGNGVLGQPGAANGDGGQATAASLSYPGSMAFDSAGNIYILDLREYVVREINILTGIITTVAGNGQQCGAAGNPNQLPSCGDDSQATSASLYFPLGLAVDASGNVYVSDQGLNRIRVLTVGGAIQNYAGTGTAGFSGDFGQAQQAELNSPGGMAFFNGNLYFADAGNNRIRDIDFTGVINTVAFNGEPTFGGDGSFALAASMFAPEQVAFDAAGNMFVGGGQDNVVRRIDALDQGVMTVAGNVENLDGGFSGDGGAPNLALISNFGLTVDANENLYIADAGNNRIRKVHMVPVGAWTPATLNPFAVTQTGQQSDPQFILFTNSGLNDLVVGVQSVPADFSTAFATGCTAPPSGICEIEVLLAPPVGVGGGSVGGNLVFTTNDPNNPTVTFALSGTVATTGFLLTVNEVGTGSVFSDPQGTAGGLPYIDCPSIGCTGTFASGATVTLTAFGGVGFTFSSWSGPCTPVINLPFECTVTMSQAQTVTATFTVANPPPPPSVTVQSFGNGTGTITSTPAGISCPPTCTSTFPAGTTQVTLTGTANTGSVFVGWMDDFCSNSTGTTCVLNVIPGFNEQAAAVFSVPRVPFTKGDVFLGSTAGMIFEYNPTTSALVQVLPALDFNSFSTQVYGMTFDANGNLFAANPNASSLEMFASNGTGPTAFAATFTPFAVAVRVDASGNLFAALGGYDPGGNLVEFAKEENGAPTASFFPGYYAGSGVAAFDFALDNVTVVYTLGGTSVYSYNTALGLQNPDLADNLPGPYAGDLRQVPDGTFLVADGDRILHLSSSGAITKTYQPAVFSLLLGLTLDPDGVDFWTDDSISGIVYKINISTGEIASQFNTNLGLNANFGFLGLGGLAVYGSQPSGGEDLTVSLAGTGTGSISSVPGGITCGTACTANFAVGTQVVLTATPTGGSTFTGWSGNNACSGTGTCTVTMSAAEAVTATFTLPSFALTVTDSGTGSGTVTSTPSGISCTSGSGTGCTANFNSGIAVTLAEAPTTGSTFAGWTGACTGTGPCSVTMSQAQSVTATFNVGAPVTISVDDLNNGTGGVGTIVDSTGVINCTTTTGQGQTGTCSTSYTAGAVVTFTETPGAGSAFTGWISDNNPCQTGTAANICKITVSNPGSVFANFGNGAGTFTLTTALPTNLSSSTGAGSVGTGVTGGGISCSFSGTNPPTGTCSNSTIKSGTVVELIPIPNDNSTFGGYAGTCPSQVGNNCYVTMSQNQTVTPVFTIMQVSLTVTVTGNGSLVDTANTGKINCTNTNGTITGTCSANYTAGTPVTLTETPAIGYTFTGFGGTLCTTSTATSCSYTLFAGSTYSTTATFTINTYLLDASTEGGSGTGTVTSNANNLGGVLNCGPFNQPPSGCGIFEQYNWSITLTALPSSGSTFAGWAASGVSGFTLPCTTSLTCTFNMPVSPQAGLTVTATFTTTTNLALNVTSAGTGGGTVLSSPAGILCPSTCTANFASGSQVTLTETPAAGSTFGGWSGAGCSGTGNCVVTMSTVENVTATFNTVNFTLTVTVFGNAPNEGSVTSSPAGINCPATTCSASFASGTQVTLTATPTVGDLFTGWSGACTNTTGTCIVTMSAAELVTADFVNTPSFALTVTDAGTGSGTVTSSPAGINCGTACSANYTSGTQVTLTETPGAGSTFAGWSGACTGTGSCVVTMSAAETVTATFNSTTASDIRSALVPFAGDGSAPVTVTWNPAFADTNYTAVCTAETTGTSFLLPVITGRTATSMTVIPTNGGATPGVVDCIAIPDSDTSDIRHNRTTFSDGQSTSTVTWSTAFPDTFYTVACSLESEATTNPGFTSVISDLQTGFVTVDNSTFLSGTFHCIAVPDSDTGSVRHGRSSLSGTAPTVTIPWNNAFTNTSYAAACSDEQFDQTSSPAAIAIDSGTKLTGSVTVINELTGGTIHCIGYVVSPQQFTINVVDSGTGSGSVVSTPAGINCPGTCSASFTSGTQVTMTATASAGSTFTGWSDETCAASGAAPCVFTVSAATTVSPIFNTQTFTLTVALAGTGTGTTTSEPTGINCPGVCSESVSSGSSVTLFAAPATGSVFAGWSGACTGTGNCIVDVTAAESVTATFNLPLPSYTLTVSISDAGTGTGTVTSSPSGIICPDACTASYVSGTQVTLTAAPATGSTFAGWSGTCTNATGTCVVTMSAAESVTALFNVSTFTFTTGPGYSTTVSTAPGGNIVVGFTVSSTTPGTVTLGCTSSAPQFLSCLITPTTLTLDGTGPSQVAIVLTSFCQGNVPGVPDGPTPGMPGGVVGVMLLGLALCGAAVSYRGRRRWALSFAIMLLAAVGGSACGNLPKGTAGATPPGTYTLTITATMAGQAPQIVQLNVNVQ